MLLRLLKTGQMIPAQNAGSVLDLEITPEPGSAFLMFSGSQVLLTRAKLITKGTGLTSFQPKIAPTYSFGGTPSMDVNVGAAITTAGTVVQGTLNGFPYFQLAQVGNTSTVSDMELVLGLGFQVRSVVVRAVVAGLGYRVGEDLVARADVVIDQ